MTPKQKKKLLAKKQPNVQPSLEEQVNKHVERVITSYIASTMLTLRDEFGFGYKRIERFLTGTSETAQAMQQGYVSTLDILDTMKEETGFDLAKFIQERAEKK